MSGPCTETTKHGECPWCESEVTPLFTAEHLSEANFQYSSPRDPKAVAKNPLMCPECQGVFGFEDFYGEAA